MNGPHDIFTSTDDSEPAQVMPSQAELNQHLHGLYKGLHVYRKTLVRHRIAKQLVATTKCDRAADEERKQHIVVAAFDADERLVSVNCPCQKDDAVKAAGLLGANTCQRLRDVLLQAALDRTTQPPSDISEELKAALQKSKQHISRLSKFRRQNRQRQERASSYMGWERDLVEKWILKPMAELGMFGGDYSFEGTGEAGEDLVYELSLQPDQHWPGRGIALIKFMHFRGSGWVIVPSEQKRREPAADAAAWANDNLMPYLKNPQLLQMELRNRRKG